MTEIEKAQTAHAWKAVTSHEQWEFVWRDLQRQFPLYKSIFRGDGAENAAVREGQRQAMLYLLRKMEVKTSDEFDDLPPANAVGGFVGETKSITGNT